MDLFDLAKERPLVILDCETTSVNVKEARIVQLAMTKLSSEGMIEESFLINPQIPIPPETTEIHGITDEMVAGEKTFKELLKHIVEFLVDCDYAGYNVKFDLNVLQAEFHRAGYSFDCFHTKQLDSHAVWKFLSPRTLEHAYDHFVGGEHPDAHDAANDVHMTRLVLEKQIEHLHASGHEFETVGDICKIINPNEVDPHGFFIKREDGEIVFNFGKNRGLLVSGKEGYLKWMYSVDFPISTKRCIEEILDNAEKEAGS